ncbi:MAG TPA: c-type cytochrome [Acidobacteriaceae bacterium]|nr:c-type cytochrome [Acidobacteriaceae bacterium]
MNIRNFVLPATLLFATTVLAQTTQGKLPLWAFPDHFSQGSSAANRSQVEHLPGSKASYTRAQIGDLFVVPDWYPDIHPPMPDVVAHGRKPDVYACGHCHLPNGQGRPENASVAGLPEAYIVQQMADFKSGLRKGSDPDMLSVTNMVKLAKSVSDEDVKAAAAYFSSFKLKPWIRVVEVEEVPKTKPEGGMMVVIKDGGTEPIGNRVIEVSENLERTELRDPTSGFIAYVPKGSVAKGKDLVTTGGSGKTMSCTMCHGADLKGTGNIPSIAGRSPSQMTRQIIDFQDGARNGSMAPMMKGVVSKLTLEDIVNITAYLASQTP